MPPAKKVPPFSVQRKMEGIEDVTLKDLFGKSTVSAAEWTKMYWKLKATGKLV